MTFGRRFLALVGACLAVVGLCAVAGCGMLNPSLFATTGLNPVRSLDTPEGSLVILVMNRTNVTVAARVTVTKQNGGQIELTIPAGPFGSGTTPDHAAVVQDCDVETIDLIGITAEGDIEIPSFSAPLRDGLELSCGKVVAIFVAALGAEPIVTVY